jgi:hypothetical protein
MKRVLILGLALLTPIPLTAQEAGGEWTAEQLEVIRMMENGPVGIEADFDGWAGSYAPSWTYWRLGADEIRDRETHLALVRDFLAQGNQVLGFSLEPVDIRILGDVAVVRANAREVIRDTEGHRRVVRYATLSVLGHRDGVWVYLSSNLFYPPAEGGP